MWQLGKLLKSLKGDEVKKFVLAAPEIVQFLTENLEPNVIVLSLSKALILWDKIENFLKFRHIIMDRVEGYEKDIDKFEGDIEAFYGFGITSFITNKIAGDIETYYLYCLRFYIPKLVRQTWQTHQCGIGCYTMKGFERRNKESKNCMRKFSNNKK